MHNLRVQQSVSVYLWKLPQANTNTQIQAHKCKFTKTNTNKNKYTNTNESAAKCLCLSLKTASSMFLLESTVHHQIIWEHSDLSDLFWKESVIEYSAHNSHETIVIKLKVLGSMIHCWLNWHMNATIINCCTEFNGKPYHCC